MSNKGFTATATQFIRQLKQNLQEGRYEEGKFGFPIFKELVQNADDAGATTLHIGISDPPSGLKHPLLRSPGMFVINDGPFSRIDAKNLRRFGENSKASEVAKIGKFGLGLKSIFHLCEAFFFLGHLKEDTSKDFHAEILNPWSDERGGFYPEWNDFSEPDQGALWGSLATHFGGSKCFCIWIPLRQQAHCGNAPITNSFPGDALPNWLGVPELSVEIAKLIPMLMNVKSIHGWRGLGSKASKEFAISLHGNSSRRRSFDDLQPKEITTFGGSVHIDRGGKKSETVEYSGFELNPACKVLSVLQGNALWPNDLASDPATGKAIHVREKAQQHAGVTASLRRLQTGGGKLVIKWAVFLPLGGKDVLESEIPNCLLDVTLLLHGYFFVDAGRNDPLGMKSERCSGQSPSDEKQLRESWNQQLADVGTLPLIPEALWSLAKGDRGALQDHELRNVTKVLQDSDFFDQFRDQICARNHWAYIWKANRSLLWELVNSELPILELPFSADRNLPFDLFPSLPQVLRDHKVTVSDHPRLSRDAAAATWNADVACELLRRLDPEQLLGSKERAAYLVDCLDIFLRCKSDEGNRVVCRLLRDGLAKCGLDQPRKRQVPLAELVSHIPPESRLRLDLKEEYADELIRIVNQLGLDIVFVSKEMDCDTHPACAKISTEDLVRSLQGLSEKQQQNLPSSKKEAISMVAAQLIEAAADLPAAKEEIFDLPLFIAKNCRSQRTDLVSWNDLSRHRENKTIFLEPSPNAYSLQKALHKELILLVTNNQCFEILFSGDKATQCACSNVVDTIQRPDTPILSGPENRIVLLKWMLRAGADFSQTPQYQQVIRYLLHGNKSKCISDDPLWITSGGPSDVWRRITAVYLKTKQAEWSLIHSSFAEILTPESQRKFGITQIDSATVIPLIKDLGAEKFHGLSPSKAEYAELLKMIPEDQMCQQLPIHQDLEGNFVSIGECCYLDEERKLPESLIQRVTIIRGSEDHAARNRQGKLIPRMDSAAVVRTILECSNPGEYWQLLADSLAQDPELTPDMAYRIRRLKWLPLRQGGLASPDDLIILQEISDDVARLTAQHPNIFYEPGQLKDDVLSHASWPAISSKWMPDSDKALSMLGTLLLEDDRNSIGGLSDHLFDQWKEIASMIPTALLPCGELISKASSSYPSAEQQIFKELSTKKISDERVQEFLDCFRSLHQQERIKRRQKILIAVFNDYLRQKVDMQGYEVALTGQFLPNSLGGWLAAEELCCQSDGLAEESLVDASTEEVLSNSMPASLKSKDLEFSVGRPNEGIAPDEANLQSDINDAESRLRKYFDTWRDIVPNEMIGGFLALLGDEPGIRRCAEEYLGKNRTIDKTRDSFGIPDWMHKSGELREDARTFIGKQRVIVELVAGERVEVSNLLGNPIQVARDQEPKSLFVSSGKRNCLLPRIAIDGCRIPCLRLNVIDPRKLDKLDLERLLLNSAKQFIYDVYNCLESQTTLDEAWNELSESEQLDIRVAQLRVTDRAFLTLEQLGLGGDPKISPILEQFHRAERLSAEQRSKSSKVATSDRRIPDDEKRQAADKLKELFENCGELQSKTLEATRRQVSQHYQYSPASVPFEIFQNADDAVVELLGHWNLSDDAVKASKTYHVLESDECVTFAHSGRRINEYPLERRSDTMGFDDDLLKMLVLSLSNKVRSQAAGSPEVTGKFGLGFKSCYLISERPQILSGRLVFEVTGAMYPRRLIGDERGILDSIWKKSLGGNSQTTIIHLPLLNETSSDVLEGFQRLVHLVVVFSRQIRHCVFHSKAREVAWEPKSLAMVEGGAFGRLVEISLDSRKPTRHGLQLESKYGSLLFAVDSRRITRFDGQIPSIWVTAPTRELLDLGFLINGPFALDIGRAQIARESEQNREHAKNLGIRIGEQFCQLFKACDSQEGWESLRGELKLAADATAYDFWDSIYELLVDSIEERSRGDKSAEQLVLDIFWKARNRGAARLYGSCCAIPSRMEGPYRQLVSLPQLRYGIEGLLANDPEIFSVVSKWKVFLDKSPPGTVVCGSRVLKKLKRLATEAGISVPTVRTLDIPMVLDWEFNGDNRSTPDQATRMGEVISKSTLDRMQGEEQEATRKFLKDLQFKGRDDQYHPAKSLLIGHETHWDRDDRLRDERHRAAFAPDHCVLSPEYDGLAIDLFDVSRDALDAPARVMVEWIVQANQISKQQAALNYLAEGELSHELCNELKRRGLEDTWMSDLRGSAAFQSLDETLKGRLLGLIPEEVRPTIDWAPAGVVPRSCRHIEDPAMVLDRLWVWWSSNRDRPQAAFEGRTYLEEYDHQIYPRGTPQLLTSDNSFDDLHCRKGWMTLFLLALMHTMGRTTRQQNRGFLFKCESEGWLDLFASSRWDGDQWLSFVEGYLQDQVEEPQYFHWMRQFVGIFQISKYLDDYIELFLSINRIDSQFCLGEILHPRSSSLHQGGGISPPPLSRVLGIGSCFVVRELFRRGILSSLHAMEHCFVPGRPVRNIFKNLGCELTDPKMRRWDMSRDLWRFAVNHLGPDRASMGRGFDIPFLFLSDNEQLYQQIFQTVDRRDNMLDDEADDIYGY